MKKMCSTIKVDYELYTFSFSFMMSEQK